ncbi:MAG: CPBP family intramembrane metalloprotease [Candidatus Eremiobacteraeota bacterium]|nr:CPBP family intramembrane metalloprotease [Candidatus Eremiobacteraeota bacterium]
MIFVLLVGFQISIVAMIYRSITGVSDMRSLMHGDIPPFANTATEMLFIVTMLVATWVMSKIEGRGVFSYGFTGAQRLRRFLFGAVAGVLAIVALAVILVLTHNLVIDGRALHGPMIFWYALIWGFNFFLVGIAEEGTFRGYLLYTLTRGTNFFWAAIILAVMFGLAHSGNPGESPYGLLEVMVIALVFSYGIWLTGSLWWAIGLHGAWDWMQSYTLGVADSGLRVQGHLLASHPAGAVLFSGGTTGPEGSIYSLPIMLLIALGLYLAWGKRPAGIQPVAPSPVLQSSS